MRDTLVRDAQHPIPDDAKTRVLYVDPNAASNGSDPKERQDEIAARDALREGGEPNGVGALVSFLGGFVPASREYETQSFARGQSGLPLDKQAAIRSSTRERAVIGEHLDAFAAFLGEPFREFDFYVGVADGMRFVASELLCSEGRPWLLDSTLAARVSPSDSDEARLESARRECTVKQKKQVAASGLLLAWAVR